MSYIGRKKLNKIAGSTLFQAITFCMGFHELLIMLPAHILYWVQFFIMRYLMKHFAIFFNKIDNIVTSLRLLKTSLTNIPYERLGRTTFQEYFYFSPCNKIVQIVEKTYVATSAYTLVYIFSFPLNLLCMLSFHIGTPVCSVYMIVTCGFYFIRTLIITPLF